MGSQKFHGKRILLLAKKKEKYNFFIVYMKSHLCVKKKQRKATQKKLNDGTKTLNVYFF